MNSKGILIVLAIVITALNGAMVLAANEPYKNMYTGFGIEDPDPDLDKVYSNQDKCPGSPFDLFVINKSTKKNKVVISFPDSKGKNVYVKLKEVSENNQVVIAASTSEKFSKSATKEYTVVPGAITLIEGADKRMRLLYSNSAKGVAVVWLADKEGTQKGCTVSE